MEGEGRELYVRVIGISCFVVKECGEEGLTLGSWGAFSSGPPQAAHLGVTRVRWQGGEGGWEGEEVCGRKDMSSRHQKMSRSWVVGHWRWVLQCLMVHRNIVVVWEVVHYIARITWVWVGIVVEKGKPVRLGVMVHVVWHLRLVRGGNFVVRHRSHIVGCVRLEAKNSLKRLGLGRSIGRLRWVICWLRGVVSRGRLMVDWLGMWMVRCVHSKDFFQGGPMSRLVVARFGVVVDLWWMVGRFWLMIGRFWLVISRFWFMIGRFWFMVSRFWFVVGRFRLMVGWFWLVVGWLWLNIIVDRMSKVMTMMHHVSHMWILLHVVVRHADAKDLLKAERMACMIGMHGHNIASWVLVVWLVHWHWLICWFRSMICRLWSMVCWFRSMVGWLWSMVCWFRSMVCWFRVMVVLPMVEHEDILSKMVLNFTAHLSPNKLWKLPHQPNKALQGGLPTYLYSAKYIFVSPPGSLRV